MATAPARRTEQRRHPVNQTTTEATPAATADDVVANLWRDDARIAQFARAIHNTMCVYAQRGFRYENCPAVHLDEATGLLMGLR